MTEQLVSRISSEGPPLLDRRKLIGIAVDSVQCIHRRSVAADDVAIRLMMRRSKVLISDIHNLCDSLAEDRVLAYKQEVPGRGSRGSDIKRRLTL